MPSIPRQIATFFAVLAVLYTGGFIAGQFVDTGHSQDEGKEPAGEMASHGGAAAPAEEGEGHEAAPVRGLAVAQSGARLVLETPELPRGSTGELAFRVLDDEDETVRDFEVSHERRMHLIVVRRDGRGFQHLHPRMDPDGRWSTRVRLPDAGMHRVFADFGRDGEAVTLAADLRVDGAAALEPLPAPARVARTAGYDVSLEGGAPTAGDEAELTFTIARDGEPVRVQPYLGAGGHLVALREGDLAYLHVHPEGDGTAFRVTFPTPGRYRLYLQFRHRDAVRTAAFTLAVGR